MLYLFLFMIGWFFAMYICQIYYKEMFKLTLDRYLNKYIELLKKLSEENESLKKENEFIKNSLDN